jgi:peptidyl-Asp metalloendopeptidase
MSVTMNNLSNRLLSLAAVTTVAVLHSAGAVAAPKAGVPVFKDRAAANVAQLPAQAKAQTGVVGTLNAAAINAAAIDLTLADGQVVTARLQRVVRDDNKRVQSWIGTFDDAPGSSLVLTKAKGVVTGFANYKDQTLEILPAAAGKHVQYAVDSRRLPKTDDGMQKSVSGGGAELTTSTTYGLGETTLATGTAVVQDLLVVYTAASAAAYSQATLESMIRSAVQSANQAYQNSGVSITLNMVGLQQVAMSESGSGMQATLSSLKQNAEVRSLRDKLTADMVMLVSQDSDWCGYANLQIMSSSGGTTSDAYAVTYSKCLSNQTLAHEVGHLQQLDHNRENSTGTSAAFPYSYGYRKCVTGGFRDIMSYPCSGATQLLQFSTPKLSYNGVATGIAYETDPTRAADAARSLNDTATKVAAYKVSATTTATATTPAAPSSLATRSLAYNSVALGWSDNSSNESGFKVQRSADGVNFTEIASLGAGAVSFSDATVSARTAYYYRVRAFNSIGGSGYSNTLAVTTPDVPPAAPVAPTSVAATNKADGSALVTWADASSNETSFEIRRETWNTKRSTWTNLTVAGTVPSNIRSLVDVTGNGTYRYSVRALNAGGSSGLAGPAPVTVSGGPTRGRTK